MTAQTTVAGTGQFWDLSHVYAAGSFNQNNLALHHVTVGVRIIIMGHLVVSLSAYRAQQKILSGAWEHLEAMYPLFTPTVAVTGQCCA